MSVRNLLRSGSELRTQAYKHLKRVLDAFSEYGYLSLLAPGLVFLFVFFFVPIVILALISVQPEFVAGTFTSFTLQNYVDIFTDSYFLNTLVRTFGIAISVAVTTLVLGYPIAYHVTRLNSQRKRLFFMLLILLPYLTSVVVRTFGWLIILLENGLLNTFLRGIGFVDSPVDVVNNEYGIFIGLVHVFLPVAVIALMTSIGKIDPELEQSARDLGASRVQVFTRILLPLSKSGILGGFLLVFALSISSFTTPSILGGTTEVMATAIYTYVGQLTNFNLASALALVLMVTAIIVVSISNYVGQSRMEVQQ